MTRRFTSALAVAVFAVCALVVVSAAPAQDKVLLVRKAKVGEVSRTSGDVTLAIDAGGTQMSMAIKAIDKTTVTAVAPDGALTLQEQTESMEGTVNGTALPEMPPPPAATIVMRADGSLVSHSRAAANDIEGRMYYATRVLFSDKAVGAGDTWTRDVKADPSLGVQPGTAEFKVVAFEKIGAIDTVKISMSFREAAPDGIRTTGTFWIEKATGDEVKGEYEFSNVPMEQVGLVSGSARQARLPAGG